MNTASLQAERAHLADLLEAVQRCAYFLDAASSSVSWPLDGASLKSRQKDQPLFQSLAAFNERFAKLQDTLGAVMRHSALLMGETTTPFLRVLSLFEKLMVIDSVEAWQLCRTARNLAAHDYETSYSAIAGHFNELHTLVPVLLQAAMRLVDLCASSLDVHPTTADFETEFRRVCSRLNGSQAAAI